MSDKELKKVFKLLQNVGSNGQRNSELAFKTTFKMIDSVVKAQQKLGDLKLERSAPCWARFLSATNSLRIEGSDSPISYWREFSMSF